MKKRNSRIPNQMLRMEYGDNILPIWVDVIVFLITLILIVFFGLPWDILMVVVGILVGLDAVYYLVKWIKKIDFK